MVTRSEQKVYGKDIFSSPIAVTGEIDNVRTESHVLTMHHCTHFLCLMNGLPSQAILELAGRAGAVPDEVERRLPAEWPRPQNPLVRAGESGAGHLKAEATPMKLICTVKWSGT
jgi:hypothetical protein